MYKTKSPKEHRENPITAPPRKAVIKPLDHESLADNVVLAFEYTAILMPIKPATIEVTPPAVKDKAVIKPLDQHEPSVEAHFPSVICTGPQLSALPTNSTINTSNNARKTDMYIYSAFRKAFEPSLIASYTRLTSANSSFRSPVG